MGQKLFVVTGKGGVGKSVVAMAMAEKLAEAGERTLIVELGEHSYFAFAFGFKAQYDPLFVSPNLFHSLWSGESCLREYIRHLIPVRRVADLFFDNKIMKSFVRAAPGLKELAILGKLTSGIRDWGPPLPFDNIVLDGYSTGHFLALLRAPQGMGELIEHGPMGTESRRIVQVLKDSKFTKYHVVGLPEELPVSESLELMADIESVVGLRPKMICNRLYHFSGELRQAFDQDRGKSESFAGYLKEVCEKQDLALSQLQELGDFHVLPYVLEAQARAVVDGLKKEVDVTWA